MKKQRFNIVPAFCNSCGRHGFKIIDAEGELKETGVFHNQETGISVIKDFFAQQTENGSELDEAENLFDLHIERIFELYHEIFLLPLPLIDLTGKSFKEILKQSQEMITRIKNIIDVQDECILWVKKGHSEIFLHAPEKFEKNENPWINIIIPPKKQLSSEEFKDIFRKLESKQQAIALLDEAFKKEEINRTDYVLTLNKIQNLDNLPNQTHQEKMDSISKQN